MTTEEYIRKIHLMNNEELVDEFSRLAVAKSNEPAFTEKWNEYKEQGRVLRNELTDRMGGANAR